jgi:hypothetical protein
MRSRSLVRSLAAPLLLALGSSAEEPPLLLVVSPGVEFAAVQAARAAVPASRTPLLVGANPRVAVSGGLELQMDRTFSDAPPADIVAVLAGAPAPGLEEFLIARREKASAFLFVGESPLAARFKGGGRGVLVLIGAAESIGPLVAALGKPETAAPVPTPVLSPSPTPISGPARTVVRVPSPSPGTFDRYFSGPTPTPTPRR